MLFRSQRNRIKRDFLIIAFLVIVILFNNLAWICYNKSNEMVVNNATKAGEEWKVISSQLGK